MKHPRVLIKMDGQRLSVNQAAIRIGISPMGLWNRLEKGVSREELFRPGYGPRKESAAGLFLAAANGTLTAEEYLTQDRAND